MKLKKTAFVFLTFIIMMQYACVGAFAQTKAKNTLSPAFDVIANGQKHVKSGLLFEEVSFTLTDFKQYLGLAEFGYITVTEAPPETSGYLKVGSMTVSGGQKIDASLLPFMKFVPSSSEVEIACFRFCGDENTSGTELECTVRLIEKINYAPTVANVHENRLNVDALSGKSVSVTLSASDPEGDDVRFEIVGYPSHGVLRMVDSKRGRCVYTSEDNYGGEDSFSYVAVDEYGNYTGMASVTVNVTRDRSGVLLDDMKDSHDLSAATSLVCENIILPNVRGGAMYFLPEREVSRGEFTVMAMKSARLSPSADTSVLSDISDACDIDSDSAGYIARALSDGYLRAETTEDGRKELRCGDIVTKSEASEILSRICGYECVSKDVAVFADLGIIDAHSLRFMSAMYEYGVIDIDAADLAPNERLTREECARMLYRFKSVI